MVTWILLLKPDIHFAHKGINCECPTLVRCIYTQTYIFMFLKDKCTELNSCTGNNQPNSLQHRGKRLVIHIYTLYKILPATIVLT